MTNVPSFDDIFNGRPLMAILRGMGVERSLAVAQTAWDLGIDAVEVTVQDETDLDALRVVAAVGASRGYVVGAGTVISTDQVAAVKAAGAAFTVSPGLDLDVVRASLDAGLPTLPGVFTATEIQRACGEGLKWMKAFPASILGSAWFAAIHGPFPDVEFVATGGMSAANAAEYLRAGARVVAVGSALEDDAQLAALARLLDSP